MLGLSSNRLAAALPRCAGNGLMYHRLPSRPCLAIHIAARTTPATAEAPLPPSPLLRALRSAVTQPGDPGAIGRPPLLWAWAGLCWLCYCGAVRLRARGCLRACVRSRGEGNVRPRRPTGHRANGRGGIMQHARGARKNIFEPVHGSIRRLEAVPPRTSSLVQKAPAPGRCGSGARYAAGDANDAAALVAPAETRMDRGSTSARQVAALWDAR